MNSEFTPGLLKSVKDLNFFSNEEIEIIDYLSSRDWMVTRTQKIQLADSTYKAILLKPSPFIQNAFNLRREVVVVFSSYYTIDPRSIDAIEFLDIQELRLEEICSILISKDRNVETKIGSILKSNEESRVVIPISYDEILSNKENTDYFVNKLRSYFYSRDLFGIQDALKKDLYFFGRRDLLHTLINRHLNGENSGIFGLRKTGKTSILYSIERALDRKRSVSIFIDCQTLHFKSYNVALLFIIQNLQEKFSIKISKLKMINGYLDEEFVSDYFYDDIKTIYKEIDKRSILLIFDEVENITFDTSISENWKNGSNFVRFWQIVRSTYQRYRTENVFSFLITGTNPRCIEKSTINRVDNPIFAQFPPIYIPAFDVIQTKDMVDRLGGYMGLKFDDLVFGKLVEDFGGHPLLMRQMCSYIHKNVKESRPFFVNKTFYEILKAKFYFDEQGFGKYAQMVLEVLENWYPDEHYMLTLLSIGDYDTFKGLADRNSEYITHLIDYGIIEKTTNDYGFKIDALKGYLSNKNKYKKMNLSNEEKQEEISKRRNFIEPQLRRLVKNQLKASFGEEVAKKKIIHEIYGAKQTDKYITFSYNDFFDPYKHSLHLKEIFDIMRKNWDESFKNIFEINVEIFNAKTTLINHYRKTDAHAAIISDADMQNFRGSMEWLESKVVDY